MIRYQKQNKLEWIDKYSSKLQKSSNISLEFSKCQISQKLCDACQTTPIYIYSNYPYVHLLCHGGDDVDISYTHDTCQRDSMLQEGNWLKFA
jgi:hypothetical protein